MIAESVGTRVLFENDRARVWDMVVPPGEAMPAHVHRLPYFYAVVHGGKMRIGDGIWAPKEGEVQFYDVAGEKSDPRMVNEGDAVHREIVVELKPEPPGGYERSEVRTGAKHGGDTAPSPNVGTELLFANDRVKIWDLRLKPGDTCPKHIHMHDNFFVMIDGGLIRFENPDDPKDFHDVQFVDDVVTWVNVPPEGKIDNRLENIGTKAHRNYLIELLK